MSSDETRFAAAIVGEADVTEADLAHVVRQLPGWQRFWLVPAMIAAGMLPLVILNWSDWRGQTLTVLLPLAFVVIMSTYFQRGVRRAWIKQALANVGGPTTFHFDDYGFTSESSLRQHRLAWAGLTRAIETPLVFVVYTTPGSVLIVPKRAFTDDEVVRLGRLLPERITPIAPQKSVSFGGFSARRMLLLWIVVLVTFLTIWHFLDDAGPPHGDRAEPARQ